MDISASAADSLIGLGIGAAQLARRTDIHTSAAQPALLGADIEGRSDTPFLTSPPKTNRLCHHLLFAHPDAQSAKNTIFMFLAESLLANLGFGG